MKVLHTLTCTAAIALVALLAGCDGETIIGSGSAGLHHLTLRNGTLTAHAQGAPNAVITPAGDLSIDNKSVAVTPEQRDLLKKYYGDVVAIRQAGIETGKAGAAMAGHAIGAVASGLAHGDPDSIGPKIDAHAKEIESKAMVICNDVVALRTTQDAIAASLPAFKPYANIEKQEVDDCRSHDRVIKR
ncbi:MAG: DUF2884 domain-containing protein [Lysobacteraceae bacterium]